MRILGVRLFCNRALVWCFAAIDYEMPELGSNDLVMGLGLCPWSPTVALHVILNLGVEVALMLCFCFGTYRLVPRGTQIPYSVVVDLVAELVISQVVSKHLGSVLGLNCWILDKL
ncbi:hypothetical protein M9H77_18803 [Catharanthus roseus]|uniref:Uncharacterized protein n=1 Tax=Catharanthus roseus TaxID=4058 RepID=A0ACC0B8L8_CATRO|nr:hypothetical protein M9H77_18803 [Catharanthus roseus]